MRTAVYPGSFNPYHRGHQSIVNEALLVFDKVILAIGHNPNKSESDTDKALEALTLQCTYGIKTGCLEVIKFKGLLADYIINQNESNRVINAVIRGLRNTQDFQFEQIQQYHNEDLKIGIPTAYFISDRNLMHISSSAIKTIQSLKKG